ncbi:type II toxin-antitoxin system VapC family toxin [Acidithiobacillus thiooxidans]|uniref:type II toxin-antitoxin system VapC family toxin n=1 Tax=Acidithiobacillus thiooxidans TaxID=930 RepID=UPI000494D274|nr:type II toxin-antitoxin system VapC family toxin [Acidithiobacillus thiooxidans]MBU2811341.1 type II toxin-antitoxin system VapC family toxin [Acidithiobacillus thiooxidans]
MLITIDTSVLIAVVTYEPGRNRALELTVGRNLIAPSSVHWEMGNAFSAMIKRGRTTLKQATACLDAYSEISIKLVEVNLNQALALVSKHRIYAYDAYLLVCAMQSRSPLLTLDQPLKQVAESLSIKVLEV